MVATPPPFLGLRRMEPGTDYEAILWENGGDVSAIGAQFSGETLFTTAQVTAYNPGQVAKMNGEVWALGRTGAWKKDDPTTNDPSDTWTQVHTFTVGIPPTNGPPNRAVGLWPVDIGGKPHLISIHGVGSPGGVTTSLFVNDYDAATDTWSELGSFSLSQSFIHITGVAVWGGLVVIGCSSSTGVVRTYVYDPGAQSMATWTFTVFDTQSAVLQPFVHKHRLYAVGRQSAATAGNVALFEAQSGNWVNVKDLGVFMTNTSEGKWCGFSDGTDIRLVHAWQNGGTDYGFKFWRVNDVTLVATDVSNPVLPATLRSAADSGSGLTQAQADDGRFSIFYDVVSLPASPRFFLFFAPGGSDADNFTIYQWVDDTTELAQVDVGGNPELGPPTIASAAAMGGVRSWSTTGFAFGDILKTVIAPISDGVRLSFKVFNDTGPTNKIIRAYFSKTGGPDLAQCSLKGSATGGSASRNGNQVENVEADGSTVYTLDVDYTASSIVGGIDKIQIYLQAA